MTHAYPPPALTWTEMHAQHAGSPGADERAYDYFYPRTRNKSVESGLFAVPFWSCLESIAGTMLLGSVEAARRQLDSLEGTVTEIVRTPLSKDLIRRTRYAALAAVVLGECMGWPLHLSREEALGVLPGLADEDVQEDDARQYIWAFLAWGVTDHGLTGYDPGLLFGDIGEPPIERAGGFGPSVQGAQLQIARAMAHNAPYEVVAPTWESFRGYVPRLIASNRSSLLELCCAARACEHVLEGRPPTEVLERLRTSCR